MAARPWRIAVALLAAVGLASCELAFPVETQNVAGPSGKLDAGGAGGGSDGGACFPGPAQKFCGKQCESTSDPFYGCAAANCTPCNTTNGTATCGSNGQCAITCKAGFGDCDNNAANGCETDTQTDPYNCGGCGKNCFANTTASNWTCVGGVCKPSQCTVGKADCQGTGTCETDLTSDVNNCGACGYVCNLPNATPACQPVANPSPVMPPGTCVIGKCNPGYADCNNSPIDGCETDIQNGDPNNCGGCGKKCDTSNGQTSCLNGACTIACQTGYGNCDGNSSNGCETNLTNTTAHCGSCTTACTNAHGTTSCSNAKCRPVCAAGYGDCDGNSNNGCEVDTNTDSNNCGACGRRCTGGEICQSGTCACPSGEVLSGGTCCTPESNSIACGRKCGGTTVTNNCGQTVVCNAACTIGSCNQGVCCEGVTVPCTSNSDCCYDSCGANGKCCAPNTASCQDGNPSECCSGHCTNSVCVP